MYAASKQYQAQAAQYAGLAADAYRKAQQFNSGYQLQLSMQSLIDFNQQQIPFYQRNIKQLVKLIIKQNNLNNNYVINQNVDVNIIISNIKVKINIIQQ